MDTFFPNIFRFYYNFDRPFKEVKGYDFKWEEDGTLTVFINALGIDPKDIKIDVTSEYPDYQMLKVEGSTKDEVWNETFSTSIAFKLRKPIRKITKSFRFGLLNLKIEFDEPAKPKFELVEG